MFKFIFGVIGGLAFCAWALFMLAAATPVIAPALEAFVGVLNALPDVILYFLGAVTGIALAIKAI